MDLGGSSITPLDAPFAVLAAARRPACGEMLIAVEREFRAVDCRAVAESLDELARPLVGGDRDVLMRRGELARDLRVERIDESLRRHDSSPFTDSRGITASLTLAEAAA
jgi:hypothetical protein